MRAKLHKGSLWQIPEKLTSMLTLPFNLFKGTAYSKNQPGSQQQSTVLSDGLLKKQTKTTTTKLPFKSFFFSVWPL